MRPWPALLLALVVLVPSVLAGATLTRTLDGSDLESEVPLQGWTGKSPSLADVDGDGDLDIIAQDQNGRVYVIDPRKSRLLAELEPTYPYGPDLGPFNGPKAADLEGDGVVEVVNINRAAVVSVWRMHSVDGVLAPELAWERHLADHQWHPTADAGPVLGDVDGDGALEIVAQTEETGVYAYRANGSLLWSLPNYGGNAEPRIADVDGDGDADVVFFTDGGVVYAVDGRTAKTLWRFDATRHDAWPASITSPGIVADIDGVKGVEVVFCARNIEGGTPTYAPRPLSQHHFVLFAIRDGKLIWKAKPDWGNPLCAAYLMAFDADADGKLEIYGLDWNTIGHKPGDWERSQYAHAFAYGHDGRELWHRNEDPWNAKPCIASGDWDGDGTIDVISYGHERLDVLDARSGAILARVGLGAQIMQGPLLADIDSDGDTDAIVAIEGRAFRVYDTHAPVTTGDGWPGWDPIPAGSPPRPLPPLAELPPISVPSAATAASVMPPPAPDIEAAAEIAWSPGLVLAAIALVALARRARF